MEGNKISLNDIKDIFQKNFIGFDELNSISGLFPIQIPLIFPKEFNFERSYLEEIKNDYIFILGASHSLKNELLTINYFRKHFGVTSELGKPCMYNQDWYIKEKFAQESTLNNSWYIIKKEISNTSRGKPPAVDKNQYNAEVGLPNAILTTYVFFAYFFHTDGEILWENEYVWCSDVDSNNDQIYSGRYKDILGINNDGFSIHRHLSIKNNYGVSESINIK